MIKFQCSILTGLLLLALTSFSDIAHAGGDEIFSGGFENQFGVPATDAEASRFLTQATFGGTRAEISALRNTGYENWISQQFQRSPSLMRAALEQYAMTLTGTNEISQNDRVDMWFKHAVTGQDQLRQRMAFALSQILVASDQSDNLSGDEIMMAEYQDILTRNAFGNYYTLLKEVSLSPVMGRYLTHLRNRKRELSGTTLLSPDENYAREVMQLFAIGLHERELDFSLIDGNGAIPGVQPIATYDQNIITNLARVLTGFSYQCTGGTTTVQGVAMISDCDSVAAGNNACTGTACNFFTNNFSRNPPVPAGDIGHGIVHPDHYNPMICYPRYHDTGLIHNTATPNPVRPAAPGPYLDEPYRDKRIIGFEVPTTLPHIQIPAADRCDDLSNLAAPTAGQIAERNACVAYCNSELDQALTALFMHPNTAPMMARQLIQRFVTSNPSPQYIQRVATVFVNNGGNVRGDLGAVVKAVLMDVEARQPVTNPQFGKVREPLLKLTNMWRSFGAVSGDNRRWGPASTGATLTTYGQKPLGSPTVFNFYEPDYKQPGAIADANLFSPELQIFNETTAITVANDLWNRVCAGYGTASGTPLISGNNCSTTFTHVAPLDRAYIPPAELDALPATFEAMVEELNLRMLNGRMSGTFTPATGTKGILKTRLDNSFFAGYVHRQKALLLIHLILVSPEFSVQR